jgi:hypothetical protein
MRIFKSGATRDTEENKPDFEGYLSPLVIRGFGDYMLKHQTCADGSKRGSDNWQGLFGEGKEHYDVCMKSLLRHVLDLWLFHRGYKGRDNIEEALYAIMFNTQAYLHKLLLEKEQDENRR